MIVDCYGEHFFRLVLADDVLVKYLFNLSGHRQFCCLTTLRSFRNLLANDVVAQFDTFIANKDRRPRDQFPNFVLTFATERAVQQLS